MKKIISLMLVAVFVLGVTSAMAAEPCKKGKAVKQIFNVQGRGLVNLVTFPWELVSTFQSEKQLHSRLWPATYLPRVLLNSVTRVVSGVNDIVVLPWIVNASQDARPITRHYDLPDYAWQKE